MCPFCLGAAAWAAAGVVSAGGLGALAAVVQAHVRAAPDDGRPPDDGPATPPTGTAD